MAGKPGTGVEVRQPDSTKPVEITRAEIDLWFVRTFGAVPTVEEEDR